MSSDLFQRNFTEVDPLDDDEADEKHADPPVVGATSMLDDPEIKEAELKFARAENERKRKQDAEANIRFFEEKARLAKLAAEKLEQQQQQQAPPDTPRKRILGLF